MLLGSLALCTSAQPVYRSIGSDGKVTFSDKPPRTTADPSPGDAGDASRTNGGETARNASNASNASNTSLAALPYTLRQVVSKFPVTLYTGDNCQPCDAGRALLQRRGIPYSERTITSNDDFAALQHLGMDANLPILTLGNQHTKGFSEAEWMLNLNAAGYPPSSMLPSNYHYARPSPLAPVVTTTEKPHAAPAEATPTPAPPPPGMRTPGNPVGIQF